MTKKNVVVIGAGIGGLTSAALLASEGYRVTVFEKNSYIGGACSSYQKNGYTFDRGAHIFTSGLNGPFGVVLNKLKLNNLKFIKEINTITGMKVYRQEGCFPFDININQLFKLMQSTDDKRKDHSNNRQEQTQKPAAAGLKGMGLSSQTLKSLGKLIMNILTISSKELNQLYDDGLTVTQYLNQFTDDPFIHGIFAFLIAGMFAISPKQASAAEFIYCFNAEMTSKEGYQYPAGGAQAIPNAFAEGINKYGGEIHKNSKVEKIAIQNNKVQGVIVDGELVEAPIVISNLDIKMSVLNLIGRVHFEKEYLEIVENQKSSLSAMTFKLALKEPLIKDWGFVNLYHPSLNDWKEKYGPDAPKSNGFFGPVLSNIDPNLAPPGCQAIIFGTIVPSKVSDWNRWKDIYYADLLEFYPELEKKLDFIDVSFPKDIVEATGKPTGPVEGSALIPAQTGKNKISSTLPIEGLYVVGDTTGTEAHGIGTQLAADSGIKCANMILGT